MNKARLTTDERYRETLRSVRSSVDEIVRDVTSFAETLRSKDRKKAAEIMACAVYKLAKALRQDLAEVYNVNDCTKAPPTDNQMRRYRAVTDVKAACYEVMWDRLSTLW